MKKRFLFVLPLLMLAIFGLASCGGNTTTSKQPIGSGTTPNVTNTVTNTGSGITPTVTPTPTGPVEVKLSSISVNTSAAKTAYVVGEEFTTEGLVVTANFSDGTSKVVTDYTVDSSSFDSSKKGDYFIKVIYNYNDTVKQRSYRVGVTSILDTQNYVIGITATGAKQTYAYEDVFTSEGLVVTAYYKDGTTKELSSTEYKLDSSAFNSKARGNYEIVISYEEIFYSGTASASVKVDTCYFATVLLNLKSIKLASGTRNFLQYEDVTTSDWVIECTFEETNKEGNKVTVTDTITSGFTTDILDLIENANTPTSGSKRVTISYTYNGVTCTATAPCKVIAVSNAINAGAFEVCDVQLTDLVVDDTFTILTGYSIAMDTSTCGTQAFAKSIALNGIGNRQENAIKVTLTAGATIHACVTSQEGSRFGLYDSEGNAVKTYMAGSNNTRYEFTAPTAGTYYIWCDGSINVFFVGVWY